MRRGVFEIFACYLNGPTSFICIVLVAWRVPSMIHPAQCKSNACFLLSDARFDSIHGQNEHRQFLCATIPSRTFERLNDPRNLQWKFQMSTCVNMFRIQNAQSNFYVVHVSRTFLETTSSLTRCLPCEFYIRILSWKPK